MPECTTPLLRELVAIPSLGFCSTRKTSSHRAETARAIAQPTTPPPMIRMFASSIAPFYPRKLSMRIDFVEERFAFRQPHLRAIVHCIHGVSRFLVMVAPQRCCSMHAVLIQCIKENVKRRELFLVVVVVVRDARQRLKTGILRRLSQPHHFDNSVSAADLDIFFALPGRAGSTDFIVHKAPCSDNR